MINNLSNFSLFIIFIVSIFVGNGEVYDIPAYLFVVPIQLATIVILKYKKPSYTIVLFMCVLLVTQVYNIVGEYILYPNQGWFTQYWYWPLQVILLILVTHAFYCNIKDSGNEQQITFYLTLFLYVILTLSIWLFYSRSNKFIFGPNVMYRFVAVLGFSVIYFCCSSGDYLNRLKTSVFCILILFLAFLSFLKIESRGGLVLLIFMSFGTFHLLSNEKFVVSSAKYIIFFTIAILLSGQFQFVLDNRMLYTTDIFTDSSERFTSANIRLYMWQFLIEDLGYFVFSFGIRPEEFLNLTPAFVKYPHNIIIESIIYYGLFGAVCIFILLVTFFKSSFNVLQSKDKLDLYVLYISAMLLVSSMLSGDMRDNYGTIALCSVLISLGNKKLRQRRRNN